MDVSCRTGEGRGYGLPASLQKPVDPPRSHPAVGFLGPRGFLARTGAPAPAGPEAGAGATGTGSAPRCAAPSEAASRSRAAAGSGSARLARPPVPASAPSPWVEPIAAAPPSAAGPESRAAAVPAPARISAGGVGWGAVDRGSLLPSYGRRRPDFRGPGRRSRGPKGARDRRILGGLRQAHDEHHRACRSTRLPTAATGYDEASNDGLHFLTC